MEAARAVGVDQNDDVTRGRTFWYAKLTFKDNAARDKMIQLVSEQAEYGFKHEHGTLKYACLTPAENIDDPVMWAMEDYADGHAIHFHSSAERMQPVFGYIGSGVMDGPLQKTTVRFFEGLEILKPEIVQVNHPIVQIADIDLKAPLSPEEVKLWSSVVKAANKEPQILFFGIGLSSTNDTQLIAITAYSGLEALNDSKVKIKDITKETLASLEKNSLVSIYWTSWTTNYSKIMPITGRVNIQSLHGIIPLQHSGKDIPSLG
ncbi:hypothetical protein FVER53590_29994 [Fusarium verticillioides]|nr:hypothetical protein FVER53590_29994 [Fusarium verticillioides]